MSRYFLILLLVAGGVVVGAFMALVAAAAISPVGKVGPGEGNWRIVVVLMGGIVGGFSGYLAADLLERTIGPTPPGPSS